MSDFIRRMLNSSVLLRAPDNDGGTPDPAVDPNAGGDPVDPAAGTTPADTGTAADGGTSDPAEAPPLPSDPASATPPATGASDGQQRRLNQLVAERWAERRRAEAAEQQSRLLQEQLNQTRAAAAQQPTVDADGNPVQPAAPAARPAPQPDLQRMAADIAAQNDFNRQVGEEVAKGRGAHQDFDQVAANLQRFGELPRTFVEAAMATGKGADVMYHLGGDIAEADRILSLPPIQQAVALASLAGTLKAPAPPKTVTSAPAPVSPKVGGGTTKGTPSLEDPNMPVADWIKLREKNLPKRASR